ncbi:MAG: type IV toxin-antitoxin system AbiEi family antitoxin domain-containing protein [Aeromicrobium sp.]
MDDVFMALAMHRGGYFFRHDLIDAGLRDADIRAACRQGLLTRLRHGTYAPASLVAPMTPEQRHVLIAYSVADRIGPGVALSHHSAVLAHDASSTYGIDLDIVHLTRLDGRHSRREAGVIWHVGDLDDSELVEIDGRLVVQPARAAFESACLTTTESGLVTMSSVMHSGACTREELTEMGERLARWPRSRHARLALRLADERCETAGESRSLFMFWREGVPRPDVQVIVTDRAGFQVARTDFGWIAARHTGEFDGRVKYGRLNPHPTDPGRVLFDEKKREDLVRGEQVGMSRWTWDGMEPAARRGTAHRILGDIEQSRRIYAKNVTHISLSPAPRPRRASDRRAG